MSTATRPARLRRLDDGYACAHRNRSMCPECFQRTPGLVDVFGVVYRYDPADWAGADLSGLVFSPGTR